MIAAAMHVDVDPAHEESEALPRYGGSVPRVEMRSRPICVQPQPTICLRSSSRKDCPRSREVTRLEVDVDRLQLSGSSDQEDHVLGM